MGHVVCNKLLDPPDTPARRGVGRGHVLAFPGWYWTLLGFVGGVSAYDAYLTYVFRGDILVMEENPIGLILIRMEPAHLSYFFVAKACGTAFVLFLLAAAECASTRGLHFTQQFIRSRRERSPFSPQKFVPLHDMFHRHRQTILNGVAAFQLWLLWYLSF